MQSCERLGRVKLGWDFQLNGGRSLNDRRRGKEHYKKLIEENGIDYALANHREVQQNLWTLLT
jgi:hypothetical protein